ncbi:flagellar hook-basal body complex protein FliE [Consotaella aegiceratis]|uniref:flagellar hook-basal body complex protein FliE n=1 Tax=Consotaella aegiceratis TaxID=3097961 RepID=UPI002F3E5461
MISAIGAALPRLDTTRIDTNMGASGVSTPTAEQLGQPASFSEIMSQVASDAVGSLKQAEAVSIQGVKGEASTQAVVDAVMEAERTLQTAVALREKVIAAYQEVSRMAI